MLEAHEIRDAVLSRGFAVVPAGAPGLEPEQAARAPWLFVERLLRERPRIVERQPIKPVPDGRSFASNAEPAPLHTDSQMAFGVPPAVQIMVCVRPAARGGECVLADSWQLLERVAAGDAELYHMLFDVPRRIPFVFGDVFGATAELRSGSLVFTHAPVAPRGDAIALRLAPWIDGTPRAEVRLAAGEILVVDNHRLLHGRLGFEGSTREFVRLLAWMTPLGVPPARHVDRARASRRALEARLLGASVAARRRMGLAAFDEKAESRLAVVLEMLRGTPPGVLARREGIEEAALYRMRDAALAAALEALTDEPSACEDELKETLGIR
jgi:gamma-butyrobetaine dioxygenase